MWFEIHERFLSKGKHHLIDSHPIAFAGYLLPLIMSLKKNRMYFKDNLLSSHHALIFAPTTELLYQVLYLIIFTHLLTTKLQKCSTKAFFVMFRFYLTACYDCSHSHIFPHSFLLVFSDSTVILCYLFSKKILLTISLPYFMRKLVGIFGKSLPHQIKCSLFISRLDVFVKTSASMASVLHTIENHCAST